MQSARDEIPHISGWEIAKLQLLAQALANLFFGLTLDVIILSFSNFSASTIAGVSLLYFVIYIFIFTPFFAFLPLLFLRSARKTLKKIYEKKKVARQEVVKTVKVLMDLPAKLSLIIAVTVLLGFTLGTIIAGFLPELIPFGNMIFITGLSVGFVVSIIHAFLNYIFMENYLRQAVEFLGLVYPEINKNLNIKRLSLFFKIFLLVLLTTIASQISLWILFVSKIVTVLPGEFRMAVIYSIGVMGVTLIYVFVIAFLFSRNLTGPLKKLIIWASKITKGETKERISIITNDEISDVVEYLRQMVLELENARAVLETRVQERTKELKELASGLDKQVKDRTHELEERVNELERMHKLMVGREKRMIELKEEIARLKKITGEDNNH
jgi:methyl-accepting chemotaxis protein